MTLISILRAAVGRVLRAIGGREPAPAATISTGGDLREPTELRIHGVGGSPGPRLLGLEHPEEVEIVAEGVGTAFWKRRGNDTIEGYDWGALTSGSALQPLWVLLLPFTLLNVAGWMHPPGSSMRTRLIRGIVQVLSGLMTLSWVLWIAVVCVDLLGYQWARRLAQHESVQGFEIPGWDVGSWLVQETACGQPIQWVGVLLGLCAVLGVMAGVIRIAGNTQKAFEQTVSGKAGHKTWHADEDLSSSDFFAHPQAAARLLFWHKVVVVTGMVFVLARYLSQLSDAAPVINLGHGLVACAAVEFFLVLVLAIVSWRTRATSFMEPLRCGPAVAAVLSFSIAHAIFSGVILLVAKRFSEWPSLPATAGSHPVVAGPELAVTDLWVPLFLVAVLIATVWILGGRKLGTSDEKELPPRKSGPGLALDGVEPTWRQKIEQARGLALAARKAPWAAAVVTLGFFGAGLHLSWHRIDHHGSFIPWMWTTNVDVDASFWWGAAAWLLSALPLIVAATMRASLRSEAARRRVGILWDVLTFWPRRFHPLGVRPYSERAVVEFRERIRSHLDNDRPVLVSAHSQGSVLAFAALSSLGEKELQRVALVTYGSPLRTLYGQVFPAYFGPRRISRLSDALTDADGFRWVNFHRDTDPIGGPVFEAGSSQDRELKDPAITPTSADEVGDDDVEPDRVAWVELAGHSHYLQEPELKRCVRELKDRLRET